MSLAVATSREFAGRAIVDVYPNLSVDLPFTLVDVAALTDLDLVFLALPHGASMDLGSTLQDAGVRCVDLSADFRLKDPALYPEWFGGPHTDPARLSTWTYGLPELHRASITGATAVANPGCYPTAAILALAPLVQAGVIDSSSVVISAASGVSGAGRTPTAGVHFSHVHGSVKAYGLPAHKHTPEIEQELGFLAGAPLTVSFIPHLVPMSRGLLATCVATMTTDADAADVARAFYGDEPFVRVDDALPETGFTGGSNRALLGYRFDSRTNRVIAVAAIDNLGKGAAGQAIQNANLMLGLPETDGLSAGGVYP